MRVFFFLFILFGDFFWVFLVFGEESVVEWSSAGWRLYFYNIRGFFLRGGERRGDNLEVLGSCGGVS
jgi:hypothetical protein